MSGEDALLGNVKRLREELSEFLHRSTSDVASGAGAHKNATGAIAATATTTTNLTTAGSATSGRGPHHSPRKTPPRTTHSPPGSDGISHGHNSQHRTHSSEEAAAADLERRSIENAGLVDELVTRLVNAQQDVELLKTELGMVRAESEQKSRNIETLRSVLLADLSGPKHARRSASEKAFWEKLAGSELLSASDPPANFTDVRGAIPVHFRNELQETRAALREADLRAKRISSDFERMRLENDTLKEKEKQARVTIEKHRKELLGAVRRIYYLLEREKKANETRDERDRYIAKLEESLLQTRQQLKHVSTQPAAPNSRNVVRTVGEPDDNDVLFGDNFGVLSNPLDKRQSSTLSGLAPGAFSRGGGAAGGAKKSAPSSPAKSSAAQSGKGRGALNHPVHGQYHHVEQRLSIPRKTSLASSSNFEEHIMSAASDDLSSNDIDGFTDRLQKLMYSHYED